MSRTLPWRLGSLTLCVLLFAGALLASSPASAGHNLLPNAGFEESVLEPSPVPPYTAYQPVLPTGWIFEGAAGLFDHTAYYCLPGNICGGNSGYNSHRAAAISIPLGGRSRICADANVCVDNPATQVKRTADLAYAVNPHWRNAQPVPVTPGSAYSFSVWTYLSFVTVGEGVVTMVRWVDALGVPISIARGPERRVQFPWEFTLNWAPISATFVAPGGAAGAVILLGHSDDNWTGHIRFDEVFFGPVH